MTFKKKIMAITPFISLILFFVLRYILQEIGSDDKLKWTWLIFLLNLIIPVVLGEWKINISYPLITVVAYLILGLCFDLWHPGWVVFLTIPIYYTLKSVNYPFKLAQFKGNFTNPYHTARLVYTKIRHLSTVFTENFYLFLS